CFDLPSAVMHRADLLSLLLDRLPKEKVRLGHEMEHVERLPNGRAAVRFKNGVREEFDGVVGADGIHSRVREILFGPAPLRRRGYSIFRAISHYHGAAIRQGYNSETWGAGNRFGILAMGNGRFTWYATANADLESFGTPPERHRQLLRIFESWHEPI